MYLHNKITFVFNDLNCECRTIKAIDVSDEYVSGLKAQTEFIENISGNITLTTQKKYINSIHHSKGDVICGLFVDSELIATSGIQASSTFLNKTEMPADIIAVIGIFVFNRKYRGVGFGKIMVWAATHLYHNCIQIKWFGAGMAKKNTPSLKSFISCGYRVVYEDDNNYKVLVNCSELNKPVQIHNEKLVLL